MLKTEVGGERAPLLMLLHQRASEGIGAAGSSGERVG